MKTYLTSYYFIFLSVFFLSGCGGDSSSSSSSSSSKGGDSVVKLTLDNPNEDHVIKMLLSGDEVIYFNHNIQADRIYYQYQGDGLKFINSLDVSYSSDWNDGKITINPKEYVGMPAGEYDTFVDFALCDKQGCNEYISNKMRINFKYVIPDIKIKSDAKPIKTSTNDVDSRNHNYFNYVTIEAPEGYKDVFIDFKPEYSRDIISFLSYGIEYDDKYHVEIELKSGVEVGPGIHQDTISYKAYYNGNESMPVITNPFVVDMEYTVKETPYLKLEKVRKLKHDIKDFAYLPSINAIAIASSYKSECNEYGFYHEQDSVYLYGLEDGQSYEFDFDNKKPSYDVDVNKIATSSDGLLIAVPHYSSLGIIELNIDDLSLSKITDIDLPHQYYGKPIILNDYVYTNVESYPKTLLSIDVNSHEVYALEHDLSIDKNLFFSNVERKELYSFYTNKGEIHSYDVSNKVPTFLKTTLVSSDIDCKPLELSDSSKLYTSCGEVFDVDLDFNKYGQISFEDGSFDNVSDIIESVKSEEVIAIINRRSNNLGDYESRVSVISLSDLGLKGRYQLPLDDGKKQYPESLFKDKKGNVWIISSVGKYKGDPKPEYFNVSKVSFPAE
ncbi:hypothetical protein [Photobacterium sp. J15]|uniref:hypothetical protein n=1 Tax=Photobacterium sp. J15 TaxID=265901 RepID=UPI0007E2F80A|nr:hypothetical protein [Photobacterium sp. J15]